ncbi:VirB4 family type IV secretion system protein [Lysinibacillus sp. K60]|uniref:VirB4 family type IV secretion system protein n=1 Tax=Lysinibacillus sp. K60 TaxID=2720027 RepID=UPI001C8B2C05|nr:DUF87 domain-containing protein [Lysinibacillus sp. K60]MBX8946832.1 DUF87 domain-containing protein [Lysinibacillus sp. K60]
MFKRRQQPHVEKEQALSDVLDGSSLDMIYPFSWEECADHIESGDNFIRVIAIIDYPKSRYGNWLSELKRKKGNITIVQFLESSNSTKMVEHYNKTIKNKQAEVLKTFDPLKKRQLEKQVEAAEHQLMKFLENESSYIYQYTYIYLQAKSLDELNALSDSVHNTLVKLQLKAMTPIKAMYQTFWSVMPILENLLGDYTYKQSNTEAASSMFPFDDAEILTINPRSDVEGVNKDTGSLIAIDYLDRKNTLNQNMVVIGTSGVGKTTYMVQKILRYFARGVKVFIIDPENEYTNIVEYLGGTVVHLSSNSSTKINPLEVFSEQVMDEGPVDLDMVLKDKIQRLLGFFQVLKQDITQVEKAILDAVLREVYRDAGILKYTSFREIPSTAYPILSDVYEAIAALKARDVDRYARIEDFHYILESYVNGSKTIFNGHTNINLQSDLLSFDLKPLQNEADVQGAAYLNTFSYLWDNITENTRENVKLFVDEFHFLTQNPDAASFFYQAYKRFRKYNAGAIAGTQQIQDVLDGKMANGQNVGEAVIGNSYTKVFFGLDNKGVDDITEKLRMAFSEKEKKLLERRKQGEALIIHGTQRAFMRVELTEEELRLKDPARYEELYEVSAAITPNYEERIRMTELERQEALEMRNFEK